MSNRVMFVVDAGYYVNLQKLCGNIDIVKLKQLIQKKYGTVNRGYYFSSMDTEKQKGFHTFLRSSQGPKLEIVLKPQKQKQCNHCSNIYYVEKGIDVGISTLIIKNAYKNLYDTLVLINGDSDLLDSLVYVRDDFQKQIILIGETSSLSTELQAISTEVLLISDYIEDIRQ